MRSYLFLVVPLLTLAPTAAVAQAASYTVTQLGDNGHDPKINQRGDVTWFDYSWWNFANIRLYSASSDTVIQITDNGLVNWFPQISDEGDVVWARRSWDDTGDRAILYYDGATGEITELAGGSRHLDFRPQINGRGDAVWGAPTVDDSVWPDRAFFDSFEIFLYEAATGAVRQFTDNDVQDARPLINDRGDILWKSDGWDLLYDAASEETTVIAPEIGLRNHRDMNNSADIAWTASPFGGGQDTILYKHSTGNIIRLTDTEPWEYEAKVGGSGDVVWTGSQEVDGEFDIYYYDAETGSVRRLTDNQYFSYGYWDKDINAEGDAVWINWGPPDNELEVFDRSRDRITYIPDVPGAEWPQINDTGDVTLEGDDGIFLIRFPMRRLESYLEFYLAAGEIATDPADELQRVLDRVQGRIDEGDNDKAVQLLGQFKKEVNKALDKGNITPAAASALLALADEQIGML